MVSAACRARERCVSTRIVFMATHGLPPPAVADRKTKCRLSVSISHFSFFHFLQVFHFFFFAIFHFSFFRCFFFFIFLFSPSTCPLPAPSLKHRCFPTKNLNFKERFWVREEEERRKKKEERADRNRSPFTVARRGPFCQSRAWKPLTPIS